MTAEMTMRVPNVASFALSERRLAITSADEAVFPYRALLTMRTQPFSVVGQLIHFLTPVRPNQSGRACRRLHGPGLLACNDTRARREIVVPMLSPGASR